MLGVMMTAHRKVSILTIVLAVALVISALLNIWALTNIEKMKSGAREGFPLGGTYRSEMQNGQTSSIAFAENEQNASAGEWQWRSPANDFVEGEYVATNDPNYFVLTDSSGKTFGYVRLGYGDKTGDGFIFLSTEDSTIPMDKIGAPAFIEEPVE